MSETLDILTSMCYQNYLTLFDTRLDLLQMQQKKMERKDKGKMLSHHFIWLKEDLQAIRVTIADDGHYKIRQIRKLHQIITKPNKRNSVFIRKNGCLCNVWIKGQSLFQLISATR